MFSTPKRVPEVCGLFALLQRHTCTLYTGVNVDYKKSCRNFEFFIATTPRYGRGGYSVLQGPLLAASQRQRCEFLRAPFFVLLVFGLRDIQLSIFNCRYLTVDTQLSIFNCRHATVDIQLSIFNCRYSTMDILFSCPY